MSWSPKNFIRNLDHAFYQIEQQFRFLQKIDKAVLDASDDGEALILSLARELKAICFADEAAIIFIKQKCLSYSLITEDGVTDAIECPQWASNLVRKTSSEKVGTIQVKKTNRFSVGLQINIDTIPYAVISLSSTRITLKYSSLSDDENQRFLQQVGQQLSILSSSWFRRRLERMRLAVAGALFTENMEFKNALGAAVNRVLDHLPAPFSSSQRSTVLVQLLAYKRDVNHLTILANAGREEKSDDGSWTTDIGKPVLASDSICGLLVRQVENGGKNYLLTDPANDHPNLYKAFSGSDIPHTELVVAVSNGNAITAVLNFEFQEPNAFGDIHIHYAKEVASFLGPFIDTLLKATDAMRAKEASLLYTMYGFLIRLNATFVHKTVQKVPFVYDRLYKLKEKLKDSPLHEIANEAYNAFEEFETLSKDFMQRVPEYIKKGDIDLYGVIAGATKEFDPRRLETQGLDIRLDTPKRPIRVYASLLLQEHLYNLISNARDAITQRVRLGTPIWSEGERGDVRIQVTEQKMFDDNGAPIPGARIVVRIEDNGTGVSPDTLRQISQYRFTTKEHGTGYGLPAAIDYVRSLGGGLEFGNRPDGPGFFVEFFLDEFDHRIHCNDRTS